MNKQFMGAERIDLEQQAKKLEEVEKKAAEGKIDLAEKLEQEDEIIDETALADEAERLNMELNKKLYEKKDYSKKN